MKPAVIDASVAVKWFLDEPGSIAAEAVLENLLTRKSEFIVPELFFFEVFSVCMRQHPQPLDFAQNDMPFLLELPLLRIAMNGSLAKDAANISLQGLTGYDASYAALALSVDGEWLTFDKYAAASLGYPNWVNVLK
ncbi:MAG: type II toxin-antitoxin system VapC family toxin [Deltaproteobacteria bacterium]|nr:type II toxin-antitoxin system VapC family toxin [Deltaproteobacteria bacterium]